MKTKNPNHPAWSHGPGRWPSNESDIEQFKKHYTEKNFEAAILLLLEKKQLFEPSVYHYNLGTLYLKTNRLPLARWNLELAHFKGLNTLELETNLEQSLNKLQLGQLEEDSSRWPFPFGIGAVRPNQFQMGLLLFLTFTLLLFRWSKKVAVIFSLTALFLGLNLFWFHFKDRNLAIVLKETDIREGASAILPSSAKAPEGLKLMLQQRKQDWYLISRPEEFRGWIYAENLGIIK